MRGDRFVVRRRGILMGAAMAVMLVGAACSKKSQTASSPPVVTTPPATSAVSPSPTPAAAITVQQTGGFRFKPATLTVKTGQQITVQNVDTNQHTFTIQGQGINVVNDGGKSQPVVINLAPGTYTFICTFHVSLGMKGTITVTA